MSFAERLSQSPFPRTLGDVALRYEPSMLIGETVRGTRSLRTGLLFLGGLVAGLSAAALVLLNTPNPPIVLLVLACAAGVGAAAWSERQDARRRRFVLNFETNSLRLDFISPIAGRPRTLVVSFDAVRDVALLDQADGRECLVVDFVAPAGDDLLREVLVAFIPEAEDEGAERLQHLLHGAFGLGEVPPDSPMFDEADSGPADEFVH